MLQLKVGDWIDDGFAGESQYGKVVGVSAVLGVRIGWYDNVNDAKPSIGPGWWITQDPNWKLYPTPCDTQRPVTRLPNNFTIYLPYRPCDDDLYIESLVTTFGGCTLTAGVGFWKSGDKVVKDKITQVTCYYSGELPEMVRHLCRHVANGLKQECVALVVNGVMEYVYA